MIQVRDVHKQFATVTALDGVSLDIERGAIQALLGPNGAGKTTLLRMMLGLLKPDSGTITFAGAPPGGIETREIGYLPEDRGLYLDTRVLDTLTYFGALRGMERRAAREAAAGWLERMALSERAREPLKALSKGNQQKIQFVSAVLHGPSIVVLDEPFSGLDPLNQDFFLSLIRELRDGGATVLLSAHQMQLVERVADRVMVLNQGRPVLDGSLDEVRRRWKTGRRIRVRLEAPPGEVPALRTGASVELLDSGELDVFVPDGVRMGPVLAEIGAGFEVADIESHAVTLHDVYVQSISRNDVDVVSSEEG